MIIENNSYKSLLLQLQQNNLDAFEELFHLSRKRLYVLAYSIVNDPEVAKDIVQEFFIDFWVNQRYKQIEYSLEHYMLFAIRNRSLKHIRDQATLSRKKQMLPKIQTTLPINNLEHSELKTEMEDAINRLPPTAKKVFTLHYIEQISHMQIAKKLGISKSTVSGHISRALKELRATLKTSRV